MRKEIHAVGPVNETNSLAWGGRDGNNAASLRKNMREARARERDAGSGTDGCRAIPRGNAEEIRAARGLRAHAHGEFRNVQLGGELFSLGSGLGLRGAVPLVGAREAFLKRDFRGVAEEVAGLGNVGLRIANVAVARRIVLRGDFLTGDFVE